MSQPSVALLATGNEIKNGDILNTNAPEIAQQLFQHGIPVGTHMVSGDSIEEIETAMDFLLQSHQALIITGGLGPTSDDVTRYALAKFLDKELIFHDDLWQQIVYRLNQLGYTHIPPANRQQALFPEGAMMIPNPNGTAAGCVVEAKHRWVFMLPGPPIECLPMLKSMVIPKLIAQEFQAISLHEHWYLFGVSEGQIAEILDEMVKPYDCTTGYRICYPYIEFKIASNNETDFNAALTSLHPHLKTYLVGNGKEIASQQLKKMLVERKPSITIIDNATGGHLESILRTPETDAFLSFNHKKHGTSPDLTIHISGLEAFWNRETTKTTTLSLTINDTLITSTIPFRGSRVKAFAAESVCKTILERLKD